MILLYSDGITDQLNTRDEEYGQTRLQRVLKKMLPACRAEELPTQILGDLDQLRGRRSRVRRSDPDRDEGAMTRGAFEYRGDTLYCDGVALADIARRAGTPAYVYSASAILEPLPTHTIGHSATRPIGSVMR